MSFLLSLSPTLRDEGLFDYVRLYDTFIERLALGGGLSGISLA